MRDTDRQKYKSFQKSALATAPERTVLSFGPEILTLQVSNVFPPLIVFTSNRDFNREQLFLKPS